MKCFIFIILGFLALTSRLIGGLKNPNVLAVKCNSEMAEGDSISQFRSGRRTRDTVMEDSEEFYEDQIGRTDDEKLLRVKRDQMKSSYINVPVGYSIYKIPRLSDRSPMPVFINLNISKILDWDELNENIKMDLEFKIMWTDFKILHFHNNTHPGNGIALIDTLSHAELKSKRKTTNNPALLKSIWKPNLFTEGLLSVRQPILMARPLTLRYIPELGWFEYITRIQVKLDCSMNFHYYPADTQTCLFTIRGFSYTKSDLNLTWHKSGVYLNDLGLQSFDVQIDGLIRYDLVKSDDPDEVHDVLGFKIIARRKLSYHLIQTYLASSFYIVITTLCFLLPSTMVEVRIGISMTTLLTLTAMFGAVRESTPIVSYTKAIDTWMVGCIFFVFLTLFQFTFHIWLKHVKKSKGEDKSFDNEGCEMGIQDNPAHLKVDNSNSYGPVFSENTLTVFEKMSDHLEAYSFPLFLTIFAVYSISYWTWLFTASNYFNWNINATLNRVED